MITGKVEVETKDFTPDYDVDASVATSGSMSMNFAASTSLGICVGATEDSCITVTIDLSQDSAAGFDAMAGFNIESGTVEPAPKMLTAMYTDEMEYKDRPSCTGEAYLLAGYWAYVKKPSVTVAITSDTCCGPKTDTLYHYNGGMLIDSIDSWCLDLDVV